MFYKNQNLVHIVHSSKLDTYLPSRKWVFDLIFKSVKAFICVSNSIKNKVQKTYHTNNVKTIYNTFDFSGSNLTTESTSVPGFEYLLYFGRLEDKVKNLSLLIDAYKISNLESKGIKLVILGEGSDESKLVKKVETLELKDSIIFFPYMKNPLPFVEKAKFTVLTSRYEGFPMSILESLSVGVPIIAVDCPGTDEIIEDGFNGLLVENFNPEVLAEAMNSFIFDKEVYQNCKRNSKRSIERFSLETISKDWEALINEMT